MNYDIIIPENYDIIIQKATNPRWTHVSLVHQAMAGHLGGKIARILVFGAKVQISEI